MMDIYIYIFFIFLFFWCSARHSLCRGFHPAIEEDVYTRRKCITHWLLGSTHVGLLAWRARALLDMPMGAHPQYTH